MKTGKVLWTREFEQGINATPAVGPVSPNGKLAVVVAVGNNVRVPDHPWWCPWGDFNARALWRAMGLMEKSPGMQGDIVTLDAQTGETIWKFTTPKRRKASNAGSAWWDLHFPDHWGAPSIGGDGTVYANWSGGISYALRDNDGDGVVNPNDPQEVSCYKHGWSSNSCTAIVPGMVVVGTCRRLYA